MFHLELGDFNLAKKNWVTIFYIFLPFYLLSKSYINSSALSGLVPKGISLVWIIEYASYDVARTQTSKQWDKLHRNINEHNKT